MESCVCLIDDWRKYLASDYKATSLRLQNSKRGDKCNTLMNTYTSPCGDKRVPREVSAPTDLIRHANIWWKLIWGVAPYMRHAELACR
jgi:hypothetical protein